MLAQKNEHNKEQVVYYLSRTLVDYEIKYLYMEKLCLAIILATKKLRHYMLNHTTYVIAKVDPLKYMMNKTYQNTRTSKWIMYLTEFDLQFICQKSIKGQVIADHLVETPLQDDNLLIIELPDEHIFQLDNVDLPIELEEEWDMTIHFDGSKCEKGGGASVIFVTPQGIPIPYSFKLDFPCKNNNVEYEALILAIKIALKLKLRKVKFIIDSLLIVNQIKGIFQCKEPLLQKYKQIVENLLSLLIKYEIQATPRSNNRFVDAMASIGSLIPQNPHHRNIHIEIVQITKSNLEINDKTYDILDITIEGKNLWYDKIVKFLRDEVLPKDLIKLAMKAFIL